LNQKRWVKQLIIHVAPVPTVHVKLFCSDLVARKDFSAFYLSLNAFFIGRHRLTAFFIRHGVLCVQDCDRHTHTNATILFYFIFFYSKEGMIMWSKIIEGKFAWLIVVGRTWHGAPDGIEGANEPFSLPFSL
jgi:hypothetical protein